MTTNLMKKLQAVKPQASSKVSIDFEECFDRSLNVIQKMGSANSVLRREMTLLGPIIRAEGIDAVVDMIRHCRSFPPHAPLSSPS